LKTVIILLIIVAALVAAFFSSRFLRKKINPGVSFGRLLFYMVSVLAMIFLVTFLMVFIITRLYPSELMR
jgi:hypothetical protein